MTEDKAEIQGDTQASVEKFDPAASNRLSTGLSILDRTLNGGIPKGSLVYFSAEPVTQPEIFMFEFCTPRKTYYFTTDKSADNIRRHMAELNFSHDNVEFIDIRWDGVDRMCIVYPDGHADFIGRELKGMPRPDDVDRRAFYMTLALNRMAAQGFEFVGIISDEIIMKRTVR